jgi:Domain of unknown function (DUF1931)/Cytochrome bd terminal oxidase subunit I
MVGLGLLMAAAGVWSLVQRFRGRLYDSAWLLHAAVVMAPAGFIAVLAGWTTTKIGRHGDHHLRGAALRDRRVAGATGSPRGGNIAWWDNRTLCASGRHWGHAFPAPAQDRYPANRIALLTGINAPLAAGPYPVHFNVVPQGASMAVMGVTKFERFFRVAASLDIDKQDLKRYTDFVNHKIYDLLLRAEATAKANGRDVVDPQDLPITKGLQECIHASAKLQENDELNPILDQITARPPLDLALRDETEAMLPKISGGLGIALARSFKLIDPDIKNPATEDWERAFQIFGLLL